MSLKDKFDKFIDYFTEDGDEVASEVVAARSERPLASVPPKRELPQQASAAQEPSPVETKEKNITKLHARQQQLAIESHHSTEKYHRCSLTHAVTKMQQILLICWLEMKVS